MITHGWRLKIVSGILFLFAVIVALRLFQIQIINHPKYKNLINCQSTHPQKIVGYRGRIFSHDGTLLAISETRFSLCADPQKVKDPQRAASILSTILELPYEYIYKTITKPERRFVWIKRILTQQELEKCKNINIDGLFLEKESKRAYPHGSMLAHLLGYTGTDDIGLDGLEYALDNYLRSFSKKGKAISDAKGRMLFPFDSSLLLDNSGFDVYLTLDMRIQRVVEDELEKIFKKYNPRLCVSIVMNPKTGAILAMAQRPVFDIDNPLKSPAHLRQNVMLTTPFEPGSIFKPITLSIAMLHNLVSSDTVMFCEHGRWRIDGRVITDVKSYADMTVKEIISKSSNIGAIKIGLLIPPDTFYAGLRRFGFGEQTGINLPGESAGKIPELKKWTFYTHTSIPFGYEIMVTPLQILNAFSCIANGGKLMRPYIIKNIADKEGNIIYQGSPKIVRRVLPAEIAKKVVDVLGDVVENGTGQKAKVSGIKVAGKTGTARKLDPSTKRYLHNKYISSFAGFAPAEDPEICVLVMVDDPKGEFYGGAVAAPAVGNIIRRSLIFLGRG